MPESYRAAARYDSGISKAANLLGAPALAVDDRLREVTEPPEGGLAGPEPAALVTLVHYPGQSVGRLALTLGLTHSGAVRLADRMEAAGLVCRTPSGQGRTLALRLTEAGQRAARRVLDRRQAAVEGMVGALGARDIAALEHLTGGLLSAITTARASAWRLCRLCDEPLCLTGTGCPVDQAAGA
jgi:DNA-binding MarR family transcriptional regulator